jgi:anti-sigma factor RsiW
MFDWCKEIGKLLDAYLDGELDVTQSLRVESHLQACQECRESFLAEKEFRALVQANRPTKPAPEFAARCIHTGLDREVRRRVRAQRSWRLPWIAAALALVVGMVTFVMSQSSAPVPRLVKQSVEEHTAYLRNPASLGITSDDGEVVSAWVEERLHFDIGIPKSTTATPAITLVGASVMTDTSTPAAHVVYHMAGETVSLVVTPPQEIRLNGRDVISFRNILFHPADVSGYHTLEWSDSGHSYVLVASSPRVVNQACQICHGAEPGRNLLASFTSGI